jgi:hypothetical protein
MKSISFNSFFVIGLIIILLITCIHATKAQTIRIANNNPGATPGVNVYTGTNALQNAVNAAVSGDIIHVIPGSIDYGNVIISEKSLTLLGVGLNPKKNIGQRSLATDISLNGAGASGSRISGLHFDRLLLANSSATVHTVNNILVENCQFEVAIGPGFLSNAISNIIVRNNIIIGGNNSSEPQAFELYTNSGFLITNNIIRGHCCSGSVISGDGLTIQNNFFYYQGTNGGIFQDVDNSIIQNNIFYRVSPTLNANCLGNTFTNNISFGHATSNTFTIGVDGNTGSGNLTNVDPLITNVPATTLPWNYSWDITLLTGSPAINAGQDGTNMGPTGGATPFDPEGTFLPLIEAINMPAIVTQGTSLQVNIKAKGN